MPKITIPQVQEIVDLFEDLVEACEDYRDWLESQRPEAFKSVGGGKRINGAYQADPLEEPPPPVGTSEFRDFGYNRHLVKNKYRTQDLIDLLEGEAYDRLRQMVDGLGTMQAAQKGEWV